VLFSANSAELVERVLLVLRGVTAGRRLDMLAPWLHGGDISTNKKTSQGVFTDTAHRGFYGLGMVLGIAKERKRLRIDSRLRRTDFQRPSSTGPKSSSGVISKMRAMRTTKT
jgi:hypothetical protein